MLRGAGAFRGVSQAPTAIQPSQKVVLNAFLQSKASLALGNHPGGFVGWALRAALDCDTGHFPTCAKHTGSVSCVACITRVLMPLLR